MRWVTIWHEELSRFKYCGRSLKIGKGKLGGGDVTYLSCVPARFLLNFLQTSRPDCCGQDRDRALKWQQKILLIAEMALTQNESLDRQYIVLPKDFQMSISSLKKYITPIVLNARVTCAQIHFNITNGQ